MNSLTAQVVVKTGGRRKQRDDGTHSACLLAAGRGGLTDAGSFAGQQAGPSLSYECERVEFLDRFRTLPLGGSGGARSQEADSGSGPGAGVEKTWRGAQAGWYGIAGTYGLKRILFRRPGLCTH